MTYYNAMGGGGGIDPSMLPDYVPQAYQVLQNAGFDIRQLFPNGIPGVDTTPGGGNDGAPGDQADPLEEWKKRMLGPIPGATGWDGVNQKLQWLRQRQQMARLTNPSMQKIPISSPDARAGVHEGVHAAGLSGPRAGGLFARLGHMLGIAP